MGQHFIDGLGSWPNFVRLYLYTAVVFAEVRHVRRSIQ